MSLLSRLFRTKAQKAVDALEEDLQRRMSAVDGGLKLFTKVTGEFDGSGDEVFRVAQGKHEFFTNALIDDLGHVEKIIKTMRRDLDYSSGRPPHGFASDVIEVERLLEGTEANFGRLGKITQEMLDLAGVSDHTQRGEDFAGIKTLLDAAKGRKSEGDLEDTIAHVDKILDGIIASHEETGTISDPGLAENALALKKAATALSLAEDEWIEFLQKVIKARSIEPFRAELRSKFTWTEDRYKVYNNARAEVQALLHDNGGSAANP